MNRAASITTPASPAQRAMYFLYKLAPESHVYNVPSILQLEGSLDADRLRTALGTLARRHEALRTVLHAIDDEIVQEVRDADRGPHFGFVEATTPTPAEDAVRWAREPFDLEHGPLWRVGVWRSSNRGPWEVLGVTFHHAIMDEESSKIFGEELSRLYDGDDPTDLPPVSQYREYTENIETNEALERSLQYWLDRLAGASDLPIPGRSRPLTATEALEGDQVLFWWSADIVEQVLAGARRRRISTYMFLVGCVVATVSRLTGASDVIVGSPIGIRTADHERTIGLFSNTVALRFQLPPDANADMLFRIARRVVLEAMEHSAVAFDEVVSRLAPTRSPSAVPVIQLACIYNRELFEKTWQFDGVETEVLRYTWDASHFDLSMDLMDTGEGFFGDLSYNRHKYDRAAMNSFVEAFQMVVRELADPSSDGELQVADLDVMGPDALERWHEVSLAPGRWRVPERSSRNTTVVTLFEEAARRHPRRTAVVSHDGTLSFEALERETRAAAGALVAAGVAPGDTVAIRLARGTSLVTAVLAAWRAGATVLTLDVGDGGERVRRVCELAAVRHVVAASGQSPGGQSPDGPEDGSVPTVLSWPLRPLPSSDPLPGASAGSAAYVVFTSGTTGDPKGVVVGHAALAAHAQEQLPILLGPGHREKPLRVAGTAAVTVDVFYNNLLPTIALGQTLVLLDEDERVDPVRIVERNRDESTALTFFDVSPRFLAVLVEAGLLDANVPPRVLVIGSEAPSPLLWELLRQSPIAAFNSYGPTECTIDSTIADIHEHADPTIGYPYGGARVYIVDSGMRPVPDGFIGQICIGGSDVADGYVNDAAATARRFIPDPFNRASGGRLYLTGDLGRRMSDSSIEFLGRNDDQMKIRGFRIEPGEVEAVVNSFPDVAASAVTPVGGTKLVAHIVPRQTAHADADLVDRLRAHLRRHLPKSHVPDEFVLRPSIPLTAGGKVDRRRLVAESRQYEEPTGERAATAIETAVAAVFQSILGHPVGIFDDFFESGGDSLRALTVVVRLEKRLGVRVELAELIAAPTVASVARVVGNRLWQSSSGKRAITVIREGKGENVYLLVPPICGSTFSYRDLIDVLDAADPTIVSLDWTDLATPTLESLADLVRVFAAELRRHLPVWADRRIVLCGWSLGGVVAHALAVQLELQCTPASTLVLLDSTALDEEERAEVRRMAESLEALRHDIFQHPDRLSEMLSDSATRELVSALGVTADDLSTADPEVVLRLLPTWTHLLRVLGGHRPRAVTTRTVAVIAEGRSVNGGATNAWRELCGTFSAISTPASHWELLTRPHIDDIVRSLVSVR